MFDWVLNTPPHGDDNHPSEGFIYTFMRKRNSLKKFLGYF